MAPLSNYVLTFIFVLGLLTAQVIVGFRRSLPVLRQQTIRLNKLNPANLPLPVIFGTYFRILRKSLPWPLGGCPRLRIAEDRSGFALPSLEILAPLRVNRSHLESYLRAVDSTVKGGKPFSASDAGKEGRVPPFFIVAVTSPLFILLASHQKCPLAMVRMLSSHLQPGKINVLPAQMGAINTENSFELLDPSILKSFDAFAEKEWHVLGRMGGTAIRKKRGCEWTMSVELSDPATGKVVFRAIFKAIKFLSSRTEPRFDASKESAQTRRTEVDDVPSTGIQLHPTATSPRLYAKISQDYNPIHITSLLAKYAFALPSAIAHGNLMVAASARALELHQPDSPLVKQWRGNKAWRCTVAFRGMMPVNRTFDLRAPAPSGKEGKFIVATRDKVCVDGTNELM